MEQEDKRYLLIEICAVIIGILVFLIVFVHYYSPAIAKSETYIKFTSTPAGEKVLEFLQYVSTPDYSRNYDVDYAGIEKEVQELGLNDTNQSENTGKTLVILNYHGAVNVGPTDQYSISTSNFKSHMYELKKAGYETITLDDAYKFMRGEKEIPEKSIIITFDDGIRDSFYYTDPILKALNYSAVMFLISGSSLKGNSPYYLNEGELRKMQETGRWDLQSHGYKSHVRAVIDENGTKAPYYSNKIWIESEQRLETDEEYRQRVQSDMSIAKSLIEEKFNKPVSSMALPFGDFGQRQSNYPAASQVIINESKKLYNMIFFQYPDVNNGFRANYNDQHQDFYLVRRIPADAITAEDLMKELNAAQALPLPYKEEYDNYLRWVAAWGYNSNDHMQITLKNNEVTGGAMSYLDGSYLWKDYALSARLIDNNAEKAFLLVRFKDATTFAGCKYRANTVEILNVKSNVKQEIARSPITNVSFAAGSRITAVVQGNTLQCLVDNVPIVQANIGDMNAYGGIGLRAEDFNAIDSPVTFTDIEVKSL